MKTPATSCPIRHLRSLNRKLAVIAGNGDLPAIKKLVVAGTQIRTESDEPLCCAAEKGNLEAVRFFWIVGWNRCPKKVGRYQTRSCMGTPKL